MTVVGAGSSGEVEAVVIRARDGQRYLGVGSDHTDREFEQYGIPASKQMCVKPLAATVWPFREVEDHLDQLVMRSWMTRDGKKKPVSGGDPRRESFFAGLDRRYPSRVCPGRRVLLSVLRDIRRDRRLGLRRAVRFRNLRSRSGPAASAGLRYHRSPAVFIVRCQLFQWFIFNRRP